MFSANLKELTITLFWATSPGVQALYLTKTTLWKAMSPLFQPSRRTRKPKDFDRGIFDAQHIAVKRRIVFEAVRKLKGNTMNLPLACVDSISNAGRTGSTLQIPGGITAAVEHCFIVLSQGGSQQCEYEYNANSKSIIRHSGNRYKA